MKTREKAWHLLCDICLDGTYSNLALRQQLGSFNRVDRSFITHIVYGTLQNYRMLRYQWEALVKKEPKETIAILLDMSIYQLFYMDKVPSYAIVDEAVQLAKTQGAGYGKLVNALLRKVMKRGLCRAKGTPEEVLSIETSHPLWLIRMWNAQYGEDICRKICTYNGNVHVPAARVNTLKISKEELLHEDPLFQNGRLCEDALRYAGGSLAETDLYREGKIAIQDEASQMVAVLLDPQPGERILDVCSAPGTKTTHIAQKMRDEGVIIAGDIHEHRLELVKEGAARLGISIINTRLMDATLLLDVTEASFDRVLCDVPCSGYGVLSRKSDIKYHMRSTDMDELIPLQRKILHRASFMVKEDGVLVYSTCTLNKKENEKQIEDFLKNHSDFELLQEQTIFPFAYDCDGFYMAKLQRCISKR